MGCCGQKRSELRRRAAAAPLQRQVAAAPPLVELNEPLPAAAEVVVEYCGVAAVVLHRAVSGRSYTFSAARRTRSVSASDVADMLLDADFRLMQR